MTRANKGRLLVWIRALCVGVLLYSQFRAASLYKLLRECVSHALASGDLLACEQYPSSIEPYLYLLVFSVALAVVLSFYIEKVAKKTEG